LGPVSGPFGPPKGVRDLGRWSLFSALPALGPQNRPFSACFALFRPVLGLFCPVFACFWGPGRAPPGIRLAAHGSWPAPPANFGPKRALFRPLFGSSFWVVFWRFLPVSGLYTLCLGGVPGVPWGPSRGPVFGLFSGVFRPWPSGLAGRRVSAFCGPPAPNAPFSALFAPFRPFSPPFSALFGAASPPQKCLFSRVSGPLWGPKGPQRGPCGPLRGPERAPLGPFRGPSAPPPQGPRAPGGPLGGFFPGGRGPSREGGGPSRPPPPTAPRTLKAHLFGPRAPSRAPNGTDLLVSYFAGTIRRSRITRPVAGVF